MLGSTYTVFDFIFGLLGMAGEALGGLVGGIGGSFDGFIAAFIAVFTG